MLINSLVQLAAATGSVVSVEWLLSQDYFLFASPRLQIYQLTHYIRETGFFYLTGRTNPPYLMSPGADHHGDTFSEPARIHLLLLGHSGTFGLGVQQNETYPELLRSRIPDAKAAILAAPGYNTDDEIQVLKDALKAPEHRRKSKVRFCVPAFAARPCCQSSGARAGARRSAATWQATR